MPGWVGSDRKQTLPRDWPKHRNKRLKADGYQCTWIQVDGARCVAKATDVDHIISHLQGGTDAQSNLQSLCGYHHLRKSSSEGGAASAAARKKRRDALRRQPEVHPGLIQPVKKPPRR